MVVEYRSRGVSVAKSRGMSHLISPCFNFWCNMQKTKSREIVSSHFKLMGFNCRLTVCCTSPPSQDLRIIYLYFSSKKMDEGTQQQAPRKNIFKIYCQALVRSLSPQTQSESSQKSKSPIQTGGDTKIT